VKDSKLVQTIVQQTADSTHPDLFSNMELLKAVFLKSSSCDVILGRARNPMRRAIAISIMEELLDQDVVTGLVERARNCQRVFRYLIKAIRILISWAEQESVTLENELMAEYINAGGSVEALISLNDSKIRADRSLAYYSLPVKVQALRILWRRASPYMNATMKQSANGAFMSLWEIDDLFLQVRREMTKAKLKLPSLILGDAFERLEGESAGARVGNKNKDKF
jgi:hypothetical protein